MNSSTERLFQLFALLTLNCNESTTLNHLCFFKISFQLSRDQITPIINNWIKTKQKQEKLLFLFVYFYKSCISMSSLHSLGTYIFHQLPRVFISTENYSSVLELHERLKLLITNAMTKQDSRRSKTLVIILMTAYLNVWVLKNL